MTTLQEQFEKDFPDKGVKIIEADEEYLESNFTNWDLDLREYVNLTQLNLDNNNLTSLNISGLTNLIKLNFFGNQLDFLDVSNNPNLTDLYINADYFTQKTKLLV